jgi:alpha-tubulin suppressor-like RCC1 family protein
MINIVSGEVYGVGRNTYGSLGLGDLNHRDTWQLLPITGVVSMACGYLSNMAMTSMQ